MNTICPKCFAAKEALKCDFCGCEEIITERKENESSTKLLAEREFSVGNYKEALKYFEALYKEYPNDIYIISKRTFCLFEDEKIDIDKVGMYMEIAALLCNDSITFKSTIHNFLKYIISKENLSVLNITTPNLIKKIFNSKELYSKYLELLKEEENINWANEIDKKYPDRYLLGKYSSTFLFFQKLMSVKNLIDEHLCKEIVNKLLKEKKLNFNERRTRFGSRYSPEIKKDDILNLAKFNPNGEIPLLIFSFYFDPYISSGRWRESERYSCSDVEGIIWRWDNDFMPIKDQFEKYIKNIISSKMSEDFYIGNENISWNYSFPMEVKFVQNKIYEIEEKGNKRRKFKEKMSPNCFIATATMGSYEHPVVVDLRFFRDNWLVKRSWGISFIKWYYTHGPKAARIIEKSNFLKRATYILLVKPLHFITKK